MLHRLRRNRLLCFLSIQAPGLAVALLAMKIGGPSAPIPPLAIGIPVHALAVLLLGAAVRLERGWLLWHVIVAVALWLARSAPVPPWAYGLAFVTVFLLYRGTVRDRVPYFPSGLPTWRAVAEMLSAAGPLRFLDIGCGLGGMCAHVHRARGQVQVDGIELSPLLWLYCRLRYPLRPRLRFLLGDFGRLDLGAYDVVFAYLSPAAMPGLWEQAGAQMRGGALLLSFEFAIPGIAPDRVVAAGRGGRPLYCWRIRASNPPAEQEINR